MTNTKISALTADTTPTSDDLIPTVNDPGGTPANKSVTLGNAITKAHGLGNGVVKIAAGAMAVATANTDYATPNQDTTGKAAKTDALNSATTVVNVSAATAPTTGQALIAVDSTHATWQSLGGGGDALTSGTLAQFASTSSLQLKGVLSDETGSGAAVFANSPALVTPTGIVKGDVGLGNVDNTSDATKNAASVTLTNKTVDNTNTITVKDANFTIQDDGDTSKQVKFQASGIATSTTRTVTLPDASGTATLLGNTSTGSGSVVLATSPALTTPTGIVKGDVGLGNVDNTSDATKNSASVTLTNKTLTTPTIADHTNATHNHTNAAGGGQITDAALSAAVGIAKGGTGQVTKAAAFDALQPMSASGDLIYGGASGTGTRLPKGTDGQALVLASGAPSWATPPSISLGQVVALASGYANLFNY